MKSHYNPSQPRHPAGNPRGGQWSSDYSVASAAARKGAGLPPQTAQQRDVVYIGEWGVQDGRIYVNEPLEKEAMEERLDQGYESPRLGHEYLGLKPDEDYNLDLDRFQVRGIYGYLHDPGNPGGYIPIITFYNFRGLIGRARGNEIEDWNQWSFKIMDKLERLDKDFINPVVYVTQNAFKYELYKPRSR